MNTLDPLAQARAILDAAGVQEPEPDYEAMDPWSESALSERTSAEVLDGRYLYTAEGGWMPWSGVVWERTPTETVTEAVRCHLRDMAAEATGADGRAAATWQEREEQKTARREEVENARTHGDVVRQIVATVEPPRARDADPEKLREYMAAVRGRFAGRLEADPDLEARVRREMRRVLTRTGWDMAA